MLINAPHDKQFVFHDGTRSKNLLELVSKLENIEDHEFHQFVNHHKNDFSNWIDHVLSDKHLADKLRTVNSRSETIQLIKDKINDMTLGPTIGSSILKVSRLEDHAEQHHTEHIAGHEHHAENQAHHVEHVEEHEHHAEHHDHEAHDASNEKATSDHVFSSEAKEKLEEKEKHQKKSEEIKASRNWFKLFSKNKLSEKKLENIEHKEEEKLNPEIELEDELAQDNRENALWVALYFALVLLIIILLVYKLFL